MTKYNQTLNLDIDDTKTPAEYDTNDNKWKMPSKDDAVLAKLTELDSKVQSIIDGTTPAKTELTGSIVELAIAENVNVTAGSFSEIIEKVNMESPKIIVTAKAIGSGHDFSISYVWYQTQFETLGVGETVESGVTTAIKSEPKYIQGAKLSIRLTNNSLTDQSYNVYLLGVK